MSGHGPDTATFAKAVRADTRRPAHVTATMAFMLETRAVIRPTRFALEARQLQKDYGKVWAGMPKNFTPDSPQPRRAARRGRRR